MPERFLRAFIEADASPWFHSIMVFIGASFAGLASYLREGGALTVRMVLSAVLNSGILGLIVFLVGYSRLSNDLPLLVGISLLSGVGSASLMTFAIQLLRRRLSIFFGGEPPYCITPKE